MSCLIDEDLLRVIFEDYELWIFENYLKLKEVIPLGYQ